MTLNLTVSKDLPIDFTPKISVIGVGGGGTNAVNNMIAMDLQGVDFIVANTDAQSLVNSSASRRIQLGRKWARRRRKRRPMSFMMRSRVRTWCSSPPAWAAAPARGRRR